MADSEQSSPASAPVAETLGQKLRNARLAQDLTVEQIATELRIEAKQLKALEEGRLGDIGVPVFVKGYLRQYGHRLGLDPADLLLLYYRETNLSEVQMRPNRVIKLRDERQVTTWLLAGIVLLTVLVGLAVWWWNGGSFGVARPSSTSATAAPARATAAPEPPAAAAPAVTAPPERAAVPADDVPVEPGPAVTDALTAARDVGVADEPAANAARPLFTIPLEFTFDQESWTEVTDARGERLLFGLNTAGRRVTVRGEPPFTILLGNANAVSLVVDGEEFTIPTSGRQGDLARFSVDLAEE